MSGIQGNEPEYASESYWDNRYKRVVQKSAVEESYEWYYNFDTLSPLIVQAVENTKTASSSCSVLEIGCGDRPLIPGFVDTEGLFGNKAFSLHAIDFSKSVIDGLVQKCKGSAISYKYMDARNLEYEDEYFNFIVDKGTIDAMLCTKHIESARKNVSKIISEAVRCLKKSNGVLMIVSHVEVESPEFEILVMEIILPVLNENRDRFWRIDAHVVADSGDNSNTSIHNNGSSGGGGGSSSSSSGSSGSGSSGGSGGGSSGSSGGGSSGGSGSSTTINGSSRGSNKNKGGNSGSNSDIINGSNSSGGGKNKKRQREAVSQTMDKEQKSSFGTVYILSSSFRRKTSRIAATKPLSSRSKEEVEAFDIPFEVHEYSS